MNRYFRLSSAPLAAIARYTASAPRYSQPSPAQRAALAKALGIDDAFRHAENYTELVPTVSEIIAQVDYAWISEAARHEIGVAAGAGWRAIYVGESREPQHALGTHLDDLGRYEREYVERAARLAGIDLYAEA